MILTMKNSIFVGLFVCVLAVAMVASSVTPIIDADAKIKRGCNENTDLQTGNPHGDSNPKGNPHDTDNDDSDDDRGNPHGFCPFE
jgi:hypothetical protein